MINFNLRERLTNLLLHAIDLIACSIEPSLKLGVA